MDYKALVGFSIFGIFICLILVISIVIFLTYDKIANLNQKSSIERMRATFKLNSFYDYLIFEKKNEMFYNLVLILYFIITLTLAFFLANSFSENIIDYIELDFILMFFFITIPMILFIGILHKSQEISKSSKGLFLEIFYFIVSMLSSILSVVIILIDIEVSYISLSNIANFQLEHSFEFLNTKIPALFILINPIAALSFFMGLIMIFRIYRNKDYNKFELNQKFFSILLRDVSCFTLVLMFIFIFLGGGLYYTNPIFNFLICSVISAVLIILLALIDFNRPKIFIEKKIVKSYNPILINSILSLLYSTLFIILF